MRQPDTAKVGMGARCQKITILQWCPILETSSLVQRYYWKDGQLVVNSERWVQKDYGPRKLGPQRWGAQKDGSKKMEGG